MSLENKMLFLLDMDGTIYLDNLLFDGTLDFLSRVREKGARYVFLTNNSSKSTEAYVQKLSSIGIDSSEDDFLTSTDATALYIRNEFPAIKFYAMGTRSFVSQLKRLGVDVTNEFTDEIQGIVIGNDTELTFEKLDFVCRILTERNVPYIATNPDYVCPTEFGSVPDCGSVCDMLYNVSKRRPIFIGKPSKLMPELAMDKTGYTREQTAVIGDRIYTDIKSGINAGVTTVLVMSGETTYEILNQSRDKPDYVMESAKEIIDELKK